MLVDNYKDFNHESYVTKVVYTNEDLLFNRDIKQDIYNAIVEKISDKFVEENLEELKEYVFNESLISDIATELAKKAIAEFSKKEEESK